MAQTNFLTIFINRILFQKLVKQRGKKAPTTILLTIALDKLMQRPLREQWIQDMVRTIQELKTTFGEQLPFYFIVTKCDLIPGFLDFFSDSSKEELTQAWGITFTSASHYEPLADIFVQRFNALIKRINKQLIWRLHHEKNPYAKLYVKDFPMQLERVKEGLVECFKALTVQSDDLHLKGLYLTSATQQPTVEMETAPPPETLPAIEIQQNFLMLRPPERAHQSYFVKQLLLKSVIHHDYPPVRSRDYLFASAMAASMMIVSSAVFAYYFWLKPTVTSALSVPVEYHLTSNQSITEANRQPRLPGVDETKLKLYSQHVETI